MIQKVPLYELPIDSTSLASDATLCGAVLRIEYYRSNMLHRGGIVFDSIAATRTRAERCCTAWHIEGVYDTLAEVQNSPWVEEIRADTAERWRDEWEMHHYMI